MRAYRIIAYFLLSKFLLASEPLVSEPQMTWEIGINVYNPSNLQNKEFRFTSLSTVWNENHMVTDSFNIASGITNLKGVCGFDILDHNSGPNRSIGLGLYELRSVSSTYQAVMYLDLRDCGVTSHWNNSVGSLDFEIKFNWGYQRFEYTDINVNNDTLRIWDIFNKQSCNICFQPTTPTNLFLSYTNGNPVLHWDLSEPSSVTTYRIYREISTNPGFVQIGTVAAGTCQWTDNNFSTPNAFARYKIRAVSGDGNLESPDFSNIVQTDIKPTTPTNLQYENSNGHPRLIWNLSEPQAVATYEVWRKVCGNPPKFNQIVED